jgi:hypothetical protein
MQDVAQNLEHRLSISSINSGLGDGSPAGRRTSSTSAASSDEVFEQLHQEAVSLTENMLTELKTLKCKILSELNEERKRLELEKSNWAQLSEKYKSCLQHAVQRGPIKLNVGGKIFTTAAENLLREEGSFFSGLFSGRWKLDLDHDGCIFIDRNPIAFEYIMAYLRGDGEFVIKVLSKADIATLHREADFYQLQGLLKLTSSRLIRFEVPPSCQLMISISGNNTIARKIGNSGMEAEAIVFGPQFDLVVDSDYFEHSIRFVSGTNIDVGVASLAFVKQANTTPSAVSSHFAYSAGISTGAFNAAGPLTVSTTGSVASSTTIASPPAATYFRRFFVPVHSRVSVRFHRDSSISYAVDDRSQGTAFTGLTNGPYVIAVVLNSKNDCVELLS